jgi:galactoside O-acetyltransferase
MSSSLDSRPPTRVVEAVHSRRLPALDPCYQLRFAEELKAVYGNAGLLELYGRFALGDGFLDGTMRRMIWQALTRSCGTGLQIGPGVGFKHPETFEIGDGVFIGAQAYIQGRFDGTCRIGDNVWIGPQAYFDARDLILEDDVGWGPGAKVLGSAHTGIPLDVPIIHTDLEIKQVRIGAGADIGTNAIVLPGVHIGKGAIVGAGAVVVSDVEPFAVAAGVPAKFIRWRTNAEEGK